jgi:hypothetical protein
MIPATPWVRRTQMFVVASQVIVLILATAAMGLGQGIEAKLSQRAVYVPAGSTTFEQLADVAKGYKIPMGIERVGDDGQDTSRRLAADLGAPNQHLTVRNLIDEILKQAPGYRATVADEVLLIGKPKVMKSGRNFLNLRVPHYQVSNANLYGAEARLRLAIDRTLEPEKYARGWNGGYGNPPGTVFDTHNISIDVSDATVRQIMNEIIRQNGHAMWTVHLVPAKTKRGVPYFAQDDWPTPGFEWLIIPLDQDRNK